MLLVMVREMLQLLQSLVMIAMQLGLLVTDMLEQFVVPPGLSSTVTFSSPG